MIGLQIVPITEDGVGKTLGYRQAVVAVILNIAIELEIAIRADCYAGELSIVQLPSKRQADRGCAVIGVIADIISARHNRGSR